MTPIAKKYHLLTLCVLLSSLVLAQPAQNPQTFCNPLNLNYRFMSDAVDAREAADPVIVLFKDDYYLFASRSGGYWTSPDLRTWTLIIPTGLNIEAYAPSVIVMGDTLIYALPSTTFKSADPKSGVWLPGPALTSYGDPAMFLDNDGRLYMAYGLAQNGPIRVVELDPKTFKEVSAPVIAAPPQPSIHGWERRGDDNLMDESPWIEGSWLIKENNKYYLHYAGPGTEFKTYADGIYVADHALGPYQYASYSPFSFKPTGFVCGAGHGCTFKDKDGNYWHIGTMTISVKAMFERRLGLLPVGFSPDGDIQCNSEFGDYPQYFPGIKSKPADDNFSGMMLLSHKKYAMASSSLPDHGIQNAVDEEIRTYWSAQSGGSDEWMMLDLGKPCTVQAIQVNFAEHNTVPELVRGRDVEIYQQYILEKSDDGMSWHMLVDKSQNRQDVPHDYFELADPATTRYIKLTNVFTPGQGNFAIRDLRIFGNSEQATFTAVNDFIVDRNAADGRDAVVSWQPVDNADGYIVRYGIAPDKLFNNYMVYDAESVAMHSLNHGVDYYFGVEAFDSGTDYYSPTGELRSFQNGNWDDVNTWEFHDGTAWIHPAPKFPDESDGIVTIRDGHTVTLNVDASIDQFTVASGATLTIPQGKTLTAKNGIETDMTVEGTVINSGSIARDADATISFVNTGIYRHEQDGGALPAALWRPTSTCVINSIAATAPSNGNQNFHNILWNCPNQAGNMSMKWNGNTIGGTITIESTGSGRWQMCAPSADASAAVIIKGDIVQSAGTFTSNGTGNANTTVTINQYGNINVTGGNFSVSRGSQGGTGTTTWYLLGGNVSLADATTQNSNPNGAKFVFAGTGGAQTLTLSNVTFGGGGFPVEVADGATLDMGTSVLQGEGSFTLTAGATFVTGQTAGIDASFANTGTRTFSEQASYGFNGSGAQVTGSLMPAAVNNLTINNAAGVTLTNPVIVNGILEMQSGALSLGGNTLSYGANSALKYSASVAQTTTDMEFPAVNGPGDLIIANSKGVTLHAPRTVRNLEIGGKLKLESNTLTAASTSNATITAFVVTNAKEGALKLTSIGTTPVMFPVGTNNYAPVWITNTGTADAVSVSAVKDVTAAPYGGRVNITWYLEEAVAGGGDYTLQFGWMNGLESSTFRNDRAANAKIFNMSTMTEAGTGPYTTQFFDQPRSVSRAGITELGPFAVGRFKDDTGVMETPESIAEKFILRQNYPNPFNPTTNIAFALGRTSQVKVTVYDLLGKEIEVLYNGRLNAGDHTLQWNAVNHPSGIYMYKIIAQDFVQVKKMLLLK